MDPTVEPGGEQGRNQGEEDSGWATAPGDSHVAAFRLLDRSRSEFGASSEVWVRFKGRGSKPGPTYRYKLGSHAGAKQIFADLKGSAHPGEVVHQYLKEPRVPYDGPFYD